MLMYDGLTFEEWIAHKYFPIAGAETNPEADPASGGTATGENDPETDPETDPENDPENDPADPADPEADEDERHKRELTDLRDRLAKAEAAAQKAKQDARKAREEAAKKGGNWEQIARERQAELEEANERAQTAETRAVQAEENLDRFQREVRITRIASKLSFRDPADAIAYLKEKPELTGDDKSCDRALRQLAKEKSYLIDERRARGRAMQGENGSGGLLTKEQMERMTPAEIEQARISGLLQKSLAALQPRSALPSG